MERRLGLFCAMSTKSRYDLIVIGAGPAGEIDYFIDATFNIPTFTDLSGNPIAKKPIQLHWLPVP